MSAGGTLSLPTASAGGQGSGSDKGGGEKTPGLGGATTFRGATSASSSPTRRKRDIDSALAAWAGTAEPSIETTTAGAHRKGQASPLGSSTNLPNTSTSMIKDKGTLDTSPGLGGAGVSSASSSSSVGGGSIIGGGSGIGGTGIGGAGSTSSGSGSGSGGSSITTTSSSTSSGSGSNSSGLSAPTKGRMFKLMTRTTSVKDNKESSDMDDHQRTTIDFFADKHLFSGGSVRGDVIHMLTGFLLESFPRENLLAYFVPSSCQNWRRMEHLSPIVAELLHFIVVQRDAALSSFEDSLRQMLRSSAVADVCAFFWIYVSSSTEPTVPADLYQRFVTVASLISQDVICGVLRSVFRRLPPHSASIFRDIACFGHALLHDSDKSHRESLARVFIPPFTGRRTLEGCDTKHRPAEEITCQWLFFFAPKVVNLDADLWERRKPATTTTATVGAAGRTGLDADAPSENQSKSDLSSLGE